MNDQSPSLWKCNQCDVVLGVLTRDQRRPSLHVLRKEMRVINMTRELSVNTDRDMFVVLDLQDGMVVCGHCGNHRKWRMSDQVLDDMLERRKKRTFGLEE